MTIILVMLFSDDVTGEKLVRKIAEQIGDTEQLALKLLAILQKTSFGVIGRDETHHSRVTLVWTSTHFFYPFTKWD